MGIEIRRSRAIRSRTPTTSSSALPRTNMPRKSVASTTFDRSRVGVCWSLMRLFLVLGELVRQLLDGRGESAHGGAVEARAVRHPCDPQRSERGEVELVARVAVDRAGQ